MWRKHRPTMIHSTLAGISFATAGLAWKGYVYAPGILFLGYSGIVFLNLFRGRDTLPITATMLQMLSTAILIPLPFYIWPGMNAMSQAAATPAKGEWNLLAIAATGSTINAPQMAG